MSKLGAHVEIGPRNGYSEFCYSKPAVVLSINDGGALIEANTKSNQHTYTIFRDLTVYREAPGDINNPPGTYAEMAAFWYPKLKSVWEQNPADAYTITNEQGGGGSDLQAYKNLIAYEREIMKLANPDGFKVCVLNLAGGSPGDIEMWKELLVPFIEEAGRYGNIYGRHAYGGGDLVPTDGNTSRPFVEAAYLDSVGITTGMVITELGLDSGYGYAGDWRFVEQAKRYDELMLAHYNIIGGCLWTLGSKPDFNNPNWQSAIYQISGWISSHPTPKWVQKEIAPKSLEEFIWEESIKAQTISVNKNAALEKKLYEDNRVPTGSEKWVVYDDVTYAIQPASNLDNDRKVAVAKVPHWDNVWLQGEPDTTTPEPAVFKLQAWPTEYRAITQWFGVNPQNYIRFGLPGHDGVDIRAPLGSKIFAAADGEVFYVGSKIPGTDRDSNYGTHVRIKHADGFITIYAHLAADNFLPSIGELVFAGDRIGTSGNTGNSFGAHLHFGMKKPPGDYGWPYNIINPEPYLLDLGPVDDLTGGAPEIDLMQFFFPSDNQEFGQIYILKNNWGAGDERVQLQRSGSFSYVTKNDLWEKRFIGSEYIKLVIDTSPSNTEYYTVNGNWLPRKMRVGDAFYREEDVVFYDKATCQPKADFTWGSTIKFVKLHDTWTNNGIQLQSVAEFNWIVGGEIEEQYFFASNLGLVKWTNKRGLESSIWELVPEGSQQNNQRGSWCGVS